MHFNFKNPNSHFIIIIVYKTSIYVNVFSVVTIGCALVNTIAIPSLTTTSLISSLYHCLPLPLIINGENQFKYKCVSSHYFLVKKQLGVAKKKKNPLLFKPS